MRDKTVIGVTGGLASGKTTVANMFVSLGAFKIDADAIAHSLLREKEIKEKVAAAFGGAIMAEGEVDRTALSGTVFSDEEKLKRLNGILHPGIILRIRENMASCESPVIVIDAPLLIEAGMHNEVDVVVVVASGYETQIERAKERGMPAGTAKMIIDRQMPLYNKKGFADYVIENNEGTDKDVIKEGVEGIWKRMVTQKRS